MPNQNQPQSPSKHADSASQPGGGSQMNGSQISGSQTGGMQKSGSQGSVAGQRPSRTPQKLYFAKMHGLGNDVMVLDLVTQRAQLTPELVRGWGDRRTGIGFDQLMVLEPPNSPDCDFVLRIFNTDGSSANHCGNGARCVGRFIEHERLSPKRRFVLELPRGRIEVRLVNDDAIEVDMGQPELLPANIPFDPIHAKEIDAHRYSIDTALGTLTLVPVSMGNPHGVLFVDSVLRTDVAGLGAQVQRHPAFPDGVNVGFCEVVDRGFMRLRVFERGVGETQACGSGACAAVVAARLVGATDEHVKVSLPGGRLRIVWPGPGDVVRMTGPAAFVYEGQLEL